MQIKGKRAVCISASNVMGSRKQSTSYLICKKIKEILEDSQVICDILDLRGYELNPCIGCGECFEGKRCIRDQEFNAIYDMLAQADWCFFVSPRYAPIPAKLCMLLEKTEQITYLHGWNSSSYRSELYGKLAGIISYGGEKRALDNDKAMVNDTIADALDRIQMKVIPFSFKWDTGISLPARRAERQDGIFPAWEYDWEEIAESLRIYVEVVIQTARSLYALK
ncbi:MAG: NAD(P)H-dependent oxidoreductase [Lachnospiraceae bacterium]|nr:NAD(P)H-dependent oxidoreductase [Lachnospiraceae bacterium]